MRFDEMLDSKNDAELGAMTRDRYERLMDAHDMGLCDEHPVHQYNRDNAVLRAHRVAKDADPGNVASSKEIERSDQPRPQTATDDPPPTPGTPAARGMPERNGAELAALDAAIALDALIPGLNRIRGPYSPNTPAPVDEDRIIQPRGRKR